MAHSTWFRRTRLFCIVCLLLLCLGGFPQRPVGHASSLNIGGNLSGTSPSDNLGGEISASLNIGGNLSGSASGTACGSAGGSGTFTSPNFKEGPTASFAGNVGGNLSGSLTGSLGASAAFDGAFRHTWSSTGSCAWS